MQNLVIIGAGGFGREVLSWATAAAPSIRVKGFLDDDPNASAASLTGLPIISSVQDYVPAPGDVFICAIGRPNVRRAVHEGIKNRGGSFVSLIHPTAVVAHRAVIADGVIVCPFALISVDSEVKEGAVIYYHSSVDHDAVIGRWCQVSGHCDITGGAVLEDGVFVGSHSVILPRVSVGAGATIAAGAVVTTYVSPGTTVFGVPAKPRAGV